MEKMEDWWR